MTGYLFTPKVISRFKKAILFFVLCVMLIYLYQTMSDKYEALLKEKGLTTPLVEMLQSESVSDKDVNTMKNIVDCISFIAVIIGFIGASEAALGVITLCGNAGMISDKYADDDSTIVRRNRGIDMSGYSSITTSTDYSSGTRSDNEEKEQYALTDNEDEYDDEETDIDDDEDEVDDDDTIEEDNDMSGVASLSLDMQHQFEADRMRQLDLALVSQKEAEEKKKQVQATSKVVFKYVCPACGQEFQCDDDYEGFIPKCPNCFSTLLEKERYRV